ncbi:MAG TPA: ROK family protein [Actinocrinis sp.]|nr:ROK family protein [Actinocrinis sp.]HXR71664.1 ROK family protein [Actinocrinis sp.]
MATVLALGIDIGGSGIKAAPVDTETGEPTAERFRLETPRPAGPKAVAETVGEVAAHFAWDGPVGVTFPGVVTRGTVRTAANMEPDWIGIDAATLFARVLRNDVTRGVGLSQGGGGWVPRVLNDADAAGVAEMAHGAGRGRDGVVLMLTFGTGIGSALFVDGLLVPNTEFGHLEIRGKDAERRASARVRDEKKLSWKKWAKRVQEYLSHVEALFSPDLIIVGGGVSKHADSFLPLLKLHAEIVAAQLANTAGIVGAAMAAVTAPASASAGIHASARSAQAVVESMPIAAQETATTAEIPTP